MKASSKQNHLWLNTSKYRWDRTYCDALVAYLNEPPCRQWIIQVSIYRDTVELISL